MTGKSAPEARWQIPRQEVEVGIARDEAMRRLRSWGFDGNPDGPAGVFKLLVSEVITNGLRHGGTAEALTAVMQAEGDLITFAVRDSNPAGPARPLEVAGSLPLGGRGMFLIEVMADGSGWHPDGEGKLVWFQLRVPAAALPLAATEHTDTDEGQRHRQMRDLGHRIREMRPRQHVRRLAVAS
ncbi:ATP-binding protein [Streptacidiphilus cavernicola]|uniref:ATP-binding protein n=1 Tax=Streptacidiphilus cavernicola TaxID=3342716 RepID=A0ABV6VYF5_9ACTN